MEDEADSLEVLLRPLGTECLGMMALGMHLTDVPGRPSLIRRLLEEGPCKGATVPDEAAIDEVLQRVLRKRPHLLTRHSQALASVAPLHRGGRWLGPEAPEWAPVLRHRCDCGTVLRRWRQHSTLFVTLSRGLTRPHGGFQMRSLLVRFRRTLEVVRRWLYVSLP